MNVERLKPHITVGEEHRCVRIGGTRAYKLVAEIRRRNQKQRRTGGCHGAHLLDVARQKQRAERQHRNYNE